MQTSVSSLLATQLMSESLDVPTIFIGLDIVQSLNTYYGTVFGSDDRFAMSISGPLLAPRQ